MMSWINRNGLAGFRTPLIHYPFIFLSISKPVWGALDDCSVPSASMPGGLPIVRGRSPGVVLVPGVGASFLGVGVLDFRLGVDDLSFWRTQILLTFACNFVLYPLTETCKFPSCDSQPDTHTLRQKWNSVHVRVRKSPSESKNTPFGREIQSDNLSGWLKVIQSNTDTSLQPECVCMCVSGRDRAINLCLEVMLIKSG